MSRDTSSPGVGETAGPKAGATMNKNQPEPEKPPSIFHGCVQLSMELASHDHFAVFRTFDDLNMLNLLTLQAELAGLRTELLHSISRREWTEDREFFIESGPKPADFSNLYDLNPEKGSNPEKRLNPGTRSYNELRLLNQIRDKLKEYNTTLLAVAQVRELPRPGQTEMRLLRKRLDNKDPYDPLAKLCGSAEKAWDPQCNEDLISLRTSLSGSTTVVDIFARWAMQVLADKWKNSPPGKCLEKANSESDGHTYVRTQYDRIRSALFVSRLFMALFGAISLIGPTLIMSLHASLTTSLITTSVATVLFGLVLAIGATDSSGQDVLGATAAYCAVLIVFVGTSLSVKAT